MNGVGVKLKGFQSGQGISVIVENSAIRSRKKRLTLLNERTRGVKRVSKIDCLALKMRQNGDTHVQSMKLNLGRASEEKKAAQYDKSSS